MSDNRFSDELEDEPAGVVGNIVRVVKAGASKIPPDATELRLDNRTRDPFPAQDAIAQRRSPRRCDPCAGLAIEERLATMLKAHVRDPTCRISPRRLLISGIRILASSRTCELALTPPPYPFLATRRARAGGNRQ